MSFIINFFTTLFRITVNNLYSKQEIAKVILANSICTANSSLQPVKLA